MLFETGTGASIYSNTNVGAESGAAWKYLGVLTNEKPSAIFKLGSSISNMEGAFAFLEIGISIEPNFIIEQLQMENSAKAIAPASLNVTSMNTQFLARGIGQNMFNYLVSYARPAMVVAQMEPDLEVVPIKVLHEWFNGLQRRCASDPEGLLRLLQYKNQL